MARGGGDMEVGLQSSALLSLTQERRKGNRDTRMGGRKREEGLNEQVEHNGNVFERVSRSLVSFGVLCVNINKVLMIFVQVHK